MNCKDFSDQLLWWQEGTLSPTEISFLKSHVITCVSCQTLSKDYQTLFQTLKTMKSEWPLPSDAHFDHLWSKIENEIHPKFKKNLKRWDLFQWLSIPTYAIPLVLILGLLTWTLFQKQNSDHKLLTHLDPKIQDALIPHEEADFWIEEVNQLDTNDLVIIMKGLET